MATSLSRHCILQQTKREGSRAQHVLKWESGLPATTVTLCQSFQLLEPCTTHIKKGRKPACLVKPL